VSKTAIRNWIILEEEGGMENLALLKRGRPTGALRTLTPVQERAICKVIVDKTPDQLKMPFALWTRIAISDLIATRYGIRLPVRTLGHYLKRWGFTPQRPKRQAYEQQPKVVRAWLDTKYPAIAERAHKEKAEILWGDETGLSNQDSPGRGYGPRGQTPIARGLTRRHTTSMISAVGNRGTLRFMVYPGALKVAGFLRFLRRLVKSSDRKIFLIVDNLRVHKAAKVQKWLDAHRAEIEIFYLPAYSPELNPDEYLNQATKAQLRNRPAAASQKEITQRVRSQMRRNQKNPAFVRSLFRHPSVHYAA
jgi:transposase